MTGDALLRAVEGFSLLTYAGIGKVFVIGHQFVDNAVGGDLDYPVRDGLHERMVV